METALHIAVKKEHVKSVEFLLKNGANVNSQDFMNRTPLYLATIKANLEIMTLLMDFGADPRICDYYGFSPFHIVASLSLHPENVARAEILLSKDFDVDISNDRRETPLYDAIFEGNIPICVLLLNKGANPNIRNSCNNPVCFKAVRECNLNIIQLLISHGANFQVLDGRGENIYCHFPAMYNNENFLIAMKRFVSLGIDPNSGSVNPLVNFINYENVEYVTILLEAGCKLSSKKLHKSFLCAIGNENRQIIGLLLEYGADPKKLSSEYQDKFKALMSPEIE